MKKFLAFFLVSLLVLGFAGEAFARMGVLSVSGGSQSGSFSCGKVSKSQDACASRSRSNPLAVAVCVPAPTVCAQAVYYAGAAIGGILVGGLTVYSLDSYGRNFRYETPSSYQTPTWNIPDTTIGWFDYSKLLDHYKRHRPELRDLLGKIPKGPWPDPKDLDKYDRRCRDSFNRGGKLYKDMDTGGFVRFEPYSSKYGLLTAVNEAGKMISCFKMNKNDFAGRVARGRYKPPTG